MDPWSDVLEKIVNTFTFRLGPTGDASQQQLDGVASQKAYIGGHVIHEGAPQSGVQVAMKGTGYVDETDAEGRFRLGSFKYGDYILMVWPPKGKPKEMKITIPGSEDFDIEL
jgi:hypothetical protein